MSVLSQFAQSQNTDFPNVRPSLDLRFALAKKLDPRITFTRASTATYFGPDGTMRTAAVNEPRFDHDPATGQSLGLLIEESRTNLLTRGDIEGTVGAQPTSMSGVSASGQSFVVSTDVSLGPNGQSCKHTKGAGYDNNSGYFHVTVVSGQTYCASIWLYIPVSQAQNFSGKLINFQAEGTPAATNTSIGSFNTNLVGVWQRAYCVFTANSTGIGVIPRTNANAGSFFYTDCWQLEQASFPTSYVPASGGSQLTRSADNASVTGTNFSSWYNQTEGTIFTQAKSIATISALTRRFLEVTNGGAAERYLLGYSATSNTRFLVTSLSNNQASILSTSNPSAGVKMCVSYATNNFSSATNGTLSTRDIEGLVPTVDRMILGWDIGSTNANLCGTISRLTYYPLALTGEQLVNLTS